MKKLILFITLCIATFSYSQRGTYEFFSIDRRTEKGWQVFNVPGEVRFLRDSIEVQTEFSLYTFHVDSKQQFVRVDQFIYQCHEDNGNVTNLRTWQELGCPEYVIMYFYSDRKDEKYYKLNLYKCE
jgi:hypothetical protein